MINHGKPWLATALSGTAIPAAAEPADRPCGRADQSQHDQKCQEEAYGERHFRAEQSLEHPPSPRVAAAAIGYPMVNRR